MVNEIGKYLRILRIENNETLEKMASKLGYASSYLSEIENGKRPIPKDFGKKVSDIYHLPAQAAKDFDEIIIHSRPSVEILNDGNKSKMNVVYKMSTNQISDKDYEEILKLIDKKGGKK